VHEVPAIDNESRYPVSVDITSLSATKQRALLRYLRGELSMRSAEPAIQPMPSGTVPPLSLAQEQLWRRSLEVPIPLYNESITLHLNGPLKVEILKRSIAEIIRRHEIWRTSFEVIGGCPSQAVHPAPSAFPLRMVDLRHESEEERQALALHLASEEARRAFDLSTGPLLRALLIQTGDEGYRLAITAHLSIVDGVSVYQVFPRELLTLYNAFSSSRPSPLPELTIQYRDFAYWQRKWLINAQMQRQLEYWRKQLAGELPVLNWPCVSRPPFRTFRGAIHACNFPVQILTGVRNLCRREATTLFTVLGAAFTILLYRYTGQKEIILGTFAPAGRKRSEVQQLLGHFLNAVPLRIDLSDDPSFCELLKRIQIVTYDAISHDDVPLELLARELLPAVDGSRNPFFTVGVSLQPRTPLLDFGWYVTSMDAQSGGAIWDLYLAFIERSNELLGRIQYNSDLFDLAKIARLVRDLSALLAATVTHPEQRMSELASAI
jgi:surfactin family lipopeptide synthetase A